MQRNAEMTSVDYSAVVEDRALLAALCEELVPFMNGANLGRLTFLLDELVLEPSGEHLHEADRQWLEDGLQGAEKHRAVWASELERLADLGVSVLVSTSAEYPVNLTLVHDGPPMLFVQGDIREEDRRAVAVVGTRDASKAGCDLAQDVAAGLVGQGYAVVSGLAKGIDTAAHAAALNTGGRTIAVYGTPIDRVYPAANRSLARRISETGACVSQFLPGVRTGRWSFPARNLTGSGLSLATVVVEASESSGARLQAQAALKHGKRVFLVNSLVTAQPWAQQMTEASCNAKVVSSAEEIVGELEKDLAVDEHAAFA